MLSVSKPCLSMPSVEPLPGLNQFWILRQVISAHSALRRDAWLGYL
jgi:hypothetical protein